ncbi:hypothetical protein Tco_0903859, partial [Tanacetum coccineum]
MKQDNAKQVARDEKLVSSEDRVKIGKSNLRMDPSITQMEETYQVALDIIKNTQFYNAFLISADITNEIKKSEAYKLYIKYSTGLIPQKKGRGRAAQGTKATDAPKQANVVRKKTTNASKKKQPKRKLVLHDESAECEGELEHRPTGRKKRTPRAVVIQEPLSVPIKKTKESSRKLKGIELLSNATQFKIETQRVIKASKSESRFKHQTGGSSEGAGLRPEVLDELTGKFVDLYEGVGTSPEVLDKKPKDIPWKSTDEDESDNDDKDEFDDESDDEEEDDKTEKTIEQKVDEEHEAGEEQKGDEHARDEQVVVY